MRKRIPSLAMEHMHAWPAEGPRFKPPHLQIKGDEEDQRATLRLGEAPVEQTAPGQFRDGPSLEDCLQSSLPSARAKLEEHAASLCCP